MRRVSVDIGGTFTDCFVAWDEHCIESKALTTHQNLALGFNEALSNACKTLELSERELLSQVDSVRYATTLGTNALIERKGPRLGLLTTAGYKSSVPLSRAKGYGVGLPHQQQMDVPNAQRPDPIVPIPMIMEVRERIDYAGDVVMQLDEDDLRDKIRQLVDKGAEAIVVVLANSVVNPVHELRIREVFLDEYPGHMLGAIPMLLSHQVAGRKGEYVRVGEHEGTVLEVGAFNTRIRTGLGEEIVLPNNIIANGATKNYSREVQGPGYIVDTTVTIGYDTPWRQVEAMLIEAARRTPGVLGTPAPRVYQTALSDWYPEYRLVAQAIPDQPRPRAEVLSALHANIQDVFNENGVQIMSPHYVLDPHEPKLVPQAKWFTPPAQGPKA